MLTFLNREKADEVDDDDKDEKTT